MPICAKLAARMKREYGERAEEVYHRFLNTPRGKKVIRKCIEKHGSTESFDWGYRKGGQRTDGDPGRRKISPGGVDQRTGAQAMSPQAVSLAVRQSSRNRPLQLTQDEIEMFEEQARREYRGNPGRQRRSRRAGHRERP